MNHKTKDAMASFATDSIPKIIIKNSVPALIAMVMIMVYNLADTFFLGLTHNDLSVAAVSFATPLFMIFMSLGTLFGVGGVSVISRALGAGDKERAKKACSFCMWACVAIGLVFMALLWIFLDDVITMLGAGPESRALTADYMKITIGCGVFSLISNCFSSILRAEGEPMKAMTGTIVGNLLNLILDPIMILGFGWGVVGAAIATVIGNIVAAGYYLIWFLSGKSSLSISPKDFSMKDGILKEIVAVGLSASLSNLLVSISSIVVNSQLAGYENGDLMVAGYGVTSKVIMIVTLIGIGIGSGVQPFFGYCYGAKEKKRLVDGIKMTVLFATVFCLVVAALCFIFAEPIVSIFLTDGRALGSGVHFTRILMSTAWLIGAFGVCQSTLQAIGAATPSLLACILRQAVIFLGMVFILKAIIGVDGLIWAQPVADVISLIIIVLMLAGVIRKTDFSKPAE